MKKTMLFAAIAAIALASCAKNEVIQNEADKTPVAFGVYAGRSADTKAAPIANVANLATQGGFGVFAYYTGTTDYTASGAIPNFMYNQNVYSTDSGTSWTYSPVKYWPNNDTNTANGSATFVDKVSFFAYAPYVANTSAAGATANTVGITAFSANDAAQGTKNPEVTYVVATNPAQSVDFLYNDIDNTNKTKATATISNTINFDFKHALTRLGFTVEGVFDETDADDDTHDVDENTKIYVTSLSVTTSGSSTGGVFDLFTKTWTDNVATVSSFNVTASNIPSALKDGGTGVTNSPVNLLNDGEYFMLIPDRTAKTYTFNIVYNVVTTDANLSGGKSTITNNITKNATLTLLAGKAYTIRLQLGMTTVKLFASVTDWTPQVADPIWLPINNS